MRLRRESRITLFCLASVQWLYVYSLIVDQDVSHSLAIAHSLPGIQAWILVMGLIASFVSSQVVLPSTRFLRSILATSGMVWATFFVYLAKSGLGLKVLLTPDSLFAAVYAFVSILLLTAVPKQALNYGGDRK